MTINEPTTIVEQVDAAVADAIADYGDEVDESSVHHGVAYGVCWVWYHSTDSEQRRSANEYWEAHFGESFQDRLRRPL